MNYYQHHIGDWAQATAHLTFVEDAAYSRLVRKYYADEKPLPADIKAVQRLIGARSQAERAAVAAMLEEFFELIEDGWHSKRCDAEVAKYRAKSQSARASANARWSDSGSNANGMRTHSDGNTLQDPIPNPHTPITKREGERIPPDFGSNPDSREFEKPSVSKRVPADFEPDRMFALETIPDLDADAEMQKFRDWEFEKPRSDWQAAWRTWIRKAREDGRYARRAGVIPTDTAAWAKAKARAKAIGFRDRDRMETPASYQTAMDTFERDRPRGPRKLIEETAT